MSNDHSELVPWKVATKMMLAVDWDPADFKVRDKISSAIADECEYRNRKRKEREKEAPEERNPPAQVSALRRTDEKR